MKPPPADICLQAAWAENSNDKVTINGRKMSKAAFHGIPSGGEYDKSVKKEEQYKMFQKYMQYTLSVHGGDPSLAKSLRDDPTYDGYIAWTKTGHKEVMSFQTMEIWNLIREADSGDISIRANDIEDAFTYITTHRQKHQTPATFSV